MQVIPYFWTFRAKFMDPEGKNYIYKARCVAPGDLQIANIDFDSDGIYAPVASHESMRLLKAYCASTHCILEGEDIANAYFYGDTTNNVFMEQPCDSLGKQAAPGLICKLKKSINGLRYAGNIWGSVLHNHLISAGFTSSTFDHRIYLLKHQNFFIPIAIAVDDMAIASNDRILSYQFKP